MLVGAQATIFSPFIAKIRMKAVSVWLFPVAAGTLTLDILQFNAISQLLSGRDKAVV